MAKLSIQPGAVIDGFTIGECVHHGGMATFTSLLRDLRSGDGRNFVLLAVNMIIAVLSRKFDTNIESLAQTRGDQIGFGRISKLF